MGQFKGKYLIKQQEQKLLIICYQTGVCEINVR